MKKITVLFLIVLLQLSPASTALMQSTLYADFKPFNRYLMVKACDYYTLVLRDNGSVWGWGSNKDRQLSSSAATKSSAAAIPIKQLVDVRQIAAGKSHLLFLKNDGSVWAYGQGNLGQLGAGTAVMYSLNPVKINGLEGIIAIDAKGDHSVALKNDGSVWCWGNNDFGQLGDGNNITSFVPVKAVGLDGVISIAAGETHTLALKNDGTVWNWGDNISDLLCDGTEKNRNSPIQVQDLTDIKAVYAGDRCTAALNADGSIYCWGGTAFINKTGRAFPSGNDTSYLSVNVSKVAGISGVKAVSIGKEHILALKNDGTVWAWGNNTSGQLGYTYASTRYDPIQVSGLTNITSVSAGSGHNIALKDDGTIWTWGSNSYSELGYRYITGASNNSSPSKVKDNILTLNINNPYMLINGDSKEIDPGKGTSPIIMKGKTLLPIRALIEELGGKVSWDEVQKKITIQIGTRTIELWIGSAVTRIDGVEKPIDVSPLSINGRTMLPLRYVAENLGYNVTWDGTNQSITIPY